METFAQPSFRRKPESRGVRFPLTLSVSKGLSGVEGWFDKLTMSGYAKVSTRGEGTPNPPLSMETFAQPSFRRKPESRGFDRSL